MRKKTNIIIAASLPFLIFGMVIATRSFAITGPSAGAGVGSGLINVEPTGTGNLSVGATAADASAKFQITGTTANSSAFGLKVWPSSGSVNFQVRNDGVVSIASTTYINGGICFGAIGATDCVSSWSGVGGGVTSTPAGYVTPGYFNSIAGTGGNYSFPASLSIGTSTAPSGGVVYVNGNVGIGTSVVNARLHVNGGDLYVMDNGGSPRFLFGDTTAAGNYGGLQWNSANDYISMGTGTGGLNTLVVTEAANVGIATTTPGSPLTVAGTIYSSTGGFKFPDGTTQTTAATGGSGTNYWTLSGTDLYPTSTAYQVGIGTADPHVPLEISGASNKLGLTYSYSVVYDGPTGGELYADSNGDLHINAKRTVSTVQNRNILLSEAGGNVGIGTSTPGSSLTVVGTIYSSTGGFKFPDGTTQTTAATGGSGTNYFTLSGTSLYPTSTAYELGVGTASVDTNYAITTAGGGIKAESTSQPAGYFNSSSGYGLIVNSGNVGIGMTTPYAKLDIGIGPADGVKALGFYEASAKDNFYFEGNFAGVGNTGNWLTMKDWNGNNITTWRGDGNFGIGTVDPDYKLSVSGESYFTNGTFPVMTVERAHGSQTTDHWASVLIKAKTTGNMADGYGSGIFFAIQDSSGVQNSIGAFGADRNGADNSGRLFFDTYNAGSRDTRMVITKNGNVGIGTISPTSKLDVGATYSASASMKILDTDPSIILQRGTATTQTDWQIKNNVANLQFSYGYDATTPNAFASPLMTLTYGGNVGIATTTPTYPLPVAGVSHSSTGGFRFPDGTTQTTAASAGVSLSGTNTWTGTNYFQSAPGSGATILTSNSWDLQSYSTDGGAAAMSFHRSGAYAVNMGLNPDNSFAIGGWSDGAVNRISIAANGNTTFGTGASKINAGTVDPPYTINGEQYATYLSGMTGQKEETTGEVNIQCPISNLQCEYVIDFSKAEKGSDLWLFSKTTNLKSQMDKMSVLLTPAFDGKVWYEKDPKNMTLNIYAIPSSTFHILDSTFSVSYRLTAPRFDSAKWLNTRNEPGVDGFMIND